MTRTTPRSPIAITARLHALLASLPAPAQRRIAIHVTPAAERTLRGGHPWLYEQAIRRQSHQGPPGTLAVLYDRRNRFLAIGLYDPTSPIRVRVLQPRTPATIDQAWFAKRFASALDLRASLVQRPDTTAYRLVHGENDGLPGFVIDRYEQTLVIKLYTAAWVPHLRLLLAALEDVVASERVVLRLSRAVGQDPASLGGLTDGLTLVGAPPRGPIVFREHGLRFEADVVRGQKTGFFLDQRENRLEVARLSAGRSVLDVFAYTGGFSVYAAWGGAREVTSVELGRPAREAIRRNMALNRRHPSVARARHRVLAGDAFETLAHLHKRGKRVDLVVLDPPAFANSHKEVPKALAAYARLMRLALQVVRPGGLLVVSCCSTHVSAQAFFATVRQVAAQAGRPLRDLARTGQPLDHPIAFQEGAYLKCLFARVPAGRRPS